MLRLAACVCLCTRAFSFFGLDVLTQGRAAHGYGQLSLSGPAVTHTTL